MKQGTREDAISDFNSMNPSYVTQRRFGTEGLVEDRTFIRLRPFDRTNSRLPTIFIEDHERANPIKIVYIDKPISDII